MRIIYIANTRLPTEMAHGLQIMKMCESFVNNGVKLELVVPVRFRISELGKKDPFEYYKVDKNFKIKKIFCFDLTPLNRFLGPVSSLIQALSFSISVFFYTFFKKTDIIYGRNRFDLFLLKKPFIFEVHKIHKNLDVSIARRAKKIIAITKGLKQDLIKKGINKNKILIAPDGIDVEDFNIKQSRQECRKKLNLPLNKKIVLYTGNLFKWKGVETLALASKFLDNDIIIVIVGGLKWYLGNFKNFVKKNKLDNILILGHQDYSKIPYYLKSADCLVLTGTKSSKISKKYTSPMKMFEYMASKKPIIASDLDSFKEILNQDNSILIEPDNPKELAEGINKALNNSDLAQEIFEQAYKDVQQYTWNNRAKKILDFVL